MSLIHRLNVQEVYLNMIQSGKKTVEGRIAKDKYTLFKPGDVIQFFSEDKMINTTIVELKNFISFKGMLEYYGVQACLPDVTSIIDAVKIYHSFPGYALSESKLGVLGIKICLSENIRNDNA